MREAEDGETQEGKHTCFCGGNQKRLLDKWRKSENSAGGGAELTTHEGHCAQSLLHEDLGDGGQVVMGVVGHDDSSKQDGHYPCRWIEKQEI